MYTKHQRIAAMIGIILLILLIIATLVTAIFNFDGNGALFRAFLFATMAVPILLWIYIWFYGLITKKRTIASVFPEVEGLEEAKERQLDEMINHLDAEASSSQDDTP